MLLSADELRDLEDGLFDIGVVEQEERHAFPVRSLGYRRRQGVVIPGLHHEAGNALLHQGQQGGGDQALVFPGVGQRRHHEIPAVKVVQHHPRSVVLKEHGRADSPVQPRLSRDQAQIVYPLQPEQVLQPNHRHALLSENTGLFYHFHFDNASAQNSRYYVKKQAPTKRGSLFEIP